MHGPLMDQNSFLAICAKNLMFGVEHHTILTSNAYILDNSIEILRSFYGP